MVSFAVRWGKVLSQNYYESFMKTFGGTFCRTNYGVVNFCGGILLAENIQGYFYYKHYEVCQTFANKSTVSLNFHHIISLGSFKKWNIDLMDLLPVIKRGHRCIVVATNYRTQFSCFENFGKKLG